MTGQNQTSRSVARSEMGSGYMNRCMGHATARGGKGAAKVLEPKPYQTPDAIDLFEPGRMHVLASPLLGMVSGEHERAG